MEQLNRPHLEEATIQVLLVEDDERLARLTARYLQEHGVVVTLAHTGNDALVESSRHVFDVVLLDLMLPGRDGLEVCRDLRGRTDVPIIMVTARGEEADRVLGLETGADDYLPKPYSSRELLARIRAQVRRARGKAGPSTQPVQAGRLLLDPRSLRATLDGRPLQLTTYEFSLLRVLAERAGRVLSREQLLDLVKGSADEVFDRSVDVHIFRLRQKLEVDPRNPLLLKTVRGAGYMLATGEET
ncbi:response regulator transcription factor [Myxococcus sp. CA051A]|uniref:response regulator transcription factor n=1 Tax=Myxococcus TaxID=32 RepID=UPI00157AD1BC|nr:MULTISPECIES: response regulator transcription factor [Myxococcus]NTX05645.1 response regulator transcription factor [Myxococcus sp. CA040A]NTX10271.1 response regulator transcription factor [Myxococcus sp. CA056]NTX37525.1 response regulator transcription factor [Myxococcus sp. CA033]NTX53167.1 response regulator transcription factor [Myxococcus sp. CA039A]NTX67696.1 response regulator transcription factor [Myxococcus sp. CA051A]